MEEIVKDNERSEYLISSTNRLAARAEHIADYYVTPLDKIVEFLKEFEKVEPLFKTNPYTIDPCAGGDLNHPMSYPKAIETLYGDTDYSIYY